MNPLLLMALAGGNGRGLNPGILKAVMAARRESFNKWFVVADMIVALLVQLYFWNRGVPDTVDATTKLPVYTTEAAIKLIQATSLEDKRHLGWTTAVQKIMEAIKSAFAPSSQEEAFIEMLSAGGLGAAQPQTVVVQQPPMMPTNPYGFAPPRPMVPYGPQVGVGNPIYRRAQGTFIDDNGNVQVF